MLADWCLFLLISSQFNPSITLRPPTRSILESILTERPALRTAWDLELLTPLAEFNVRTPHLLLR
jgi:hypothetical protein